MRSPKAEHDVEAAGLPNKGMKLTKPEHIGALQLIPGVIRTLARRWRLATANGVGRQVIALFLLLGSGCTPFLPSDKAGLMEAMGSNDMRVNFSAAHKLERLFGVPGLLEAMEHPSANTRAVAAHSLMNHPGPEVEAALIRGADDPDEYVRMWCAFSLGKVGSVNARPILEHLSQDGSEVVSRQAAEALEELQDRLGGGRNRAG
jgi:HEAT repeat protein